MTFCALLRRCANSNKIGYNYGFARLMSTKDQIQPTEEKEDQIYRRLYRLSAAEWEYQAYLRKKITIPVPKDEDVGLTSGTPEEHIKTRRVRIYQPPKNSMQSGTDNVGYWQIDFDTRQRWENPLIGWTSSGDPLSNLKVDFANVEEAITHCKKMGWDYYVQKPTVSDAKPRSYGMNFSWNKRSRVSTK